MIRPAIAGDAGAIARIYNHYIQNTVITFEEQIVSTEEMASRIEAVTAVSLPWLVAEDAGRITGYAYATKWRPRSAYRFSVELTVYLDPECVGKGLGSQLYTALFALLKDKGVHSVIGGVAQPNPASTALHEKFGMTKVAHFTEVGFKFGKWVDVGYWQATL